MFARWTIITAVAAMKPAMAFSMAGFGIISATQLALPQPAPGASGGAAWSAAAMAAATAISQQGFFFMGRGNRKFHAPTIPKRLPRLAVSLAAQEQPEARC